MPKISIIIPIYNGSHTIIETLESVFRQSYSDFEVIVIDDGSTDDLMGTLALVPDPRMQVFHYINGGLAVARNRGISLAQGEYLIFLDADDLWTSDKLESHIDALENAQKTNSNVGVVYSWNYFLDHVTHECFVNEPSYHEGNVLEALVTHNFIINGSNPMISRAAIESTGRFREDLLCAADWDYWIKLAQNWEFILIPKRQVFYRQIQTSMSSRVDKMEWEQVEVIESTFKALPAKLQPLKKVALSNIYFYSAQLYSRRHHSRESIALLRSKLWQAIVLNPKLLRGRETQILIFKWLLRQLFSQHLPQGFLNRSRSIPKLPNRSGQPLEALLYSR